jgi:putative ABC transport system permease protein
LRLADYRRLTHDANATDVAVTVAPGASVDWVMSGLRALPFGSALEFSQPGEIRARSLGIFDRSFAVTYLLEAVAIMIGLFGVAATFSAQTLARSREFGMLRHVGVTRRQILAILAKEGGMLTALGIAMGFVLGFAISLILVFVVNPQSFHWSMSLHMPWLTLSVVAMVMLVASCATAVVAGRRAVSVDAVRAVKEDW